MEQLSTHIPVFSRLLPQNPSRPLLCCWLHRLADVVGSVDSVVCTREDVTPRLSLVSGGKWGGWQQRAGVCTPGVAQQLFYKVCSAERWPRGPLHGWKLARQNKPRKHYSIKDFTFYM